MEKVIIVFTDDNNNMYGVLKVISGYSEKGVKVRLNNIIVDLFGCKEKFFDDFSANLCKVLEVFGDEICSEFGDNCVLDFSFDNCSMFNVDNVFDDEVKGYDESDVKELVDTICCMLDNNSRLGISGMGENFVDWCENGECFTDYNKNVKKELMKYVCVEVDKLSGRLYKLFDNLEK